MTETCGRWGVDWEVSMGLENWPFNSFVGVGAVTEPAKATARPGVAVGKPRQSHRSLIPVVGPHPSVCFQESLDYM